MEFVHLRFEKTNPQFFPKHKKFNKTLLHYFSKIFLNILISYMAQTASRIVLL